MAQNRFQPDNMKQPKTSEFAAEVFPLTWSIRVGARIRSVNLSMLGFYLLVSIMFCALYFQTTSAWSTDHFSAYANLSRPYPGDVPLFRYRVLMPFLARSLAYVLGVDLKLIFQLLATLSVFGLLIVYRSYLSNFVRPEFATVMSVAIVYPMLWNFCLLNDLYYPFDLPSLFFFTLGCHYIYQRKWHLYYPVFVLALLNRETSCFLVFVMIFCFFRRMRSRELLWHVLAQGLIWAGLKSLFYFLLGPDTRVFALFRLSFNARMLWGILTLSGNGPKDLTKLALAFGGAWWVLPWILRFQPRFLKRSTLVVIPFIVVIIFMGFADEIRDYVELIPVILSPVLYAFARGLAGAREQESVA